MVIESGSNFIELEISTSLPGSKSRRGGVAISCAGYTAFRNDTWFDEDDFQGFAGDLLTLGQSRQGQATLHADDPRHFTMVIAAIDRSGHLEVSGQIGTGAWSDAEGTLHFRFALDPSKLPHIVEHMKALAAA